VSSKSRAIIRKIDPTDGELDRFFSSMGKQTPKWLADNELVWAEFSVRLLTAYRRADKIEFLLGTTEIKNPDERAQVLKAQELLLKFIDGTNLLDDLPKNAPRNAYRDRLRELSDQAAAIIDPLWKSWEILGDTPGNITSNDMSA
jgi:hypothetical protein